VHPANRTELDDAVGLVRAAGELTLRWFRSPELVVDEKRDGTPVTVADREAETFLRERIAQRWPGDAIVGEEHPDAAGTTGRTWIIDPIDGTKAFTAGVPLYTNLLALHDEHGGVIGIVNVPALGITVWAGRGLGCFENGLPARVSDRTDVRGSVVSSSGFEHWSVDQIAAVKAAGAHLRTWGDGYGFVLVAPGRIEAMVDPQLAVWDMAPMPVILSEAGGRFSDLDGVTRIDGTGGVATNGAVHDDLLTLLR
jgi:histidinol phosphatase-like enzyme (inositol monophosphatase family)